MTCATCRYNHRDDSHKGELFCARFPPQAMPMPIPNQLTGQVQLRILSQFPTVNPTMRCGEYAPALALSS